LSIIKWSINISSPAITKNDNNEDDADVQDAVQGISLPHDPPTEEKGEGGGNNNTPVGMMSNLTIIMPILTK
jgi:hypothetical protein